MVNVWLNLLGLLLLLSLRFVVCSQGVYIRCLGAKRHNVIRRDDHVMANLLKENTTSSLTHFWIRMPNHSLSSLLLAAMRAQCPTPLCRPASLSRSYGTLASNWKPRSCRTFRMRTCLGTSAKSSPCQRTQSSTLLSRHGRVSLMAVGAMWTVNYHNVLLVAACTHLAASIIRSAGPTERKSAQI